MKFQSHWLRRPDNKTLADGPHSQIPVAVICSRQIHFVVKCK